MISLLQKHFLKMKRRFSGRCFSVFIFNEEQEYHAANITMKGLGQHEYIGLNIAKIVMHYQPNAAIFLEGIFCTTVCYHFCV